MVLEESLGDGGLYFEENKEVVAVFFLVLFRCALQSSQLRAEHILGVGNASEKKILRKQEQFRSSEEKY
ncbi:hypothetical protein N7527_010231 [Penicillium freii]|nr:hypothetical protein N7527_010231 [Penicillium freii]